jgi:hypothetical protein
MDLLGFVVRGKDALLNPKQNEVFEVLSFGITAASLPLSHGTS